MTHDPALVHPDDPAQSKGNRPRQEPMPPIREVLDQIARWRKAGLL